MNLVKLYHHNGPVWIDTDQLNGSRTRLTIYTSRGNRLSDTAKTESERFNAGCGVHRNNLFACTALAEADRERIYADMRNRSHLPCALPVGA